MIVLVRGAAKYLLANGCKKVGVMGTRKERKPTERQKNQQKDKEHKRKQKAKMIVFRFRFFFLVFCFPDFSFFLFSTIFEGFCMGGALSLTSAVVPEISASAPFYGVPSGLGN